MKLALRYIPLETWVDVFVFPIPWMKRPFLGRIVARFRNRKFAKYLQFLLHDCRKHTLHPMKIFRAPYGRAWIDTQNYWCKLHRLCWSDTFLAQSEMPENIIDFTHIEIKHFDGQVLAFLQRMANLFALDKIKLSLFCANRIGVVEPEKAKSLRTILIYLLPLIRRVSALHLDNFGLATMAQLFPGVLIGSKMLYFRACANCNESILFTFMDWLNDGQRDGNEPKLMVLNPKKNQADLHVQFVTAIREQFHLAPTQCTFAIFLIGNYNIPRFEEENACTGEKLSCRQEIFSTEGVSPIHYWMVCRYRKDAEAELKEWLEEHADWQWEAYKPAERIIALNMPTIGELDKHNVGDFKEGQELLKKLHIADENANNEASSSNNL